MYIYIYWVYNGEVTIPSCSRSQEVVSPMFAGVCSPMEIVLSSPC